MKKFEFLGDALCLDFLNTLHDAHAEDPEEELSGVADVAAWAAQAGVLTANEAGHLHAGVWPGSHPNVKNAPGRDALPGKNRAVLLDDLRALRETLRQMFQRAVRDGKVAPRDVAALNLLLGRFPAVASIEKSGGDGDWKLNWESQAGGAEKIFCAIMKSAAELVASGRWRAMRECASDTCTWMFLDTSKNHSRRWCEMSRCGNRDKVHRFRARARKAARPVAQRQTS